jgi:hypothetical protein
LKRIEMPMWKPVDGIVTQPTPTLATYTEAGNKFTKSATAFLQHVHLLNEARDAYREAVSTSASIRRSLDVGDQNLKALMTQLAQVVSSHFGEPDLEARKLGLVKDTASPESAGEDIEKISLP